MLVKGSIIIIIIPRHDVKYEVEIQVSSSIRITRILRENLPGIRNIWSDKEEQNRWEKNVRGNAGKDG